jgi:REP element-mobilizing transposase RayT
MPRKSRIDAPGALHHIIARGIERRQIFENNADRDSFLARLGDILKETETSCYAWALIPNHLLLRTGTVSISTIMRRVAGRSLIYEQERPAICVIRNKALKEF